MDPRDHQWFTAEGDLIASRLTEYDALRVATRCANKYGTSYVVQGPVYRTVIEPTHKVSIPRTRQAEQS
jgi:hypothetical protein